MDGEIQWCSHSAINERKMADCRNASAYYIHWSSRRLAQCSVVKAERMLCLIAVRTLVMYGIACSNHSIFTMCSSDDHTKPSFLLLHHPLSVKVYHYKSLLNDTSVPPTLFSVNTEAGGNFNMLFL